MKIIELEIAGLLPDPANARKHDERNISGIMGSLTRFGQQKPIVIDKSGVVVAGNGTLVAAQRLGWTKIKAVRTDLTGSQLTAYGIADNRTSELASWDDKVLSDLLRSLDAEGFDVKDIGFNIEDYFRQDVDYSILGEGSAGGTDKSTDGQLGGMREGVRKAIQIEFLPGDYDGAFELVKFWRGRGAYVGKMMVDALAAEKVKLEARAASAASAAEVEL